MTVSAGKLAGGMLLLVGVWIAVYWMWEPREPRISFASGSGTPGTDSARPAAPVLPVDAPPTREAARSLETPESRALVPGVSPAQSTTPPSDAGTSRRSPQVPETRREPESAPRVEMKVRPPEFWEHVVRSGESLQTISRDFYRTSDYATAIARANPLMDPTKLKVGKTIRIPRDPTNIQGLPLTNDKPAPQPSAPPKAAPTSSTSGAPGASARRAYKVQEGDTLSEISKKFYGTSGRTRLIYEANRDKLKSEDDLRIGVELVIPDAPPSTSGG